MSNRLKAVPPIRAVVLDMDGLMLDTETMSRTAWQRTLAEWGFPLSEERYLQLIGLTVADVGERMRGWYGAGIPYEAMYARKLALVNETIAAGGIPQKPGLAALLAAADSLGLRKAIATSTSKQRALDKLRISGVPGSFDAIAGGDEAARGKPAPDLFELAARRMGVPPQECLAFEDSDPGVLAARGAGMRVVIIPDQKPPSPEAAAAALEILPGLADAAERLPDWVKGLAKPESRSSLPEEPGAKPAPHRRLI
jgi:HAD superfamily hydrolase (TIGR01509 family)